MSPPALALSLALALALALSAAPRCVALPPPPTQVRLAFTRDAATVVVHFVSSNATDAPPFAPAAQWGLAPGALTNAAANCSSDAYVAWGIASPRLHFCTLAGLPAGQAEIYYRVGDATLGSWSAVARFRSALAVGDETPFAFAVTGDMGIEFSAPTMRAVAAAAQAADLRFFSIHNGDLAYADNRQSLYNGTIADSVINEFYDMLSDNYASNVPVLFSLGNHEMQLGDVRGCLQNGSECRGLAYVKRVAPTLPASPSPFYYSWSHGLALFVSISFESAWEPASPQFAWLRADLAAVDSAATPFVILYVHRPLYCSNTYSCNLTAPVLAAYEPLFYGADGATVLVDLVLTAHVHCFERMHQVRNGTLVGTGGYDSMRTPLYLLQGSAGCLEGSTPWLPEQPAWSAFRACESVAFGFSTVEVLNRTHLRTSFVEAGDGRVLDSVTISKAS